MSGEVILDAAGMDRTLRRMAHEILERYPPDSDICLIGIHSRGVPLAKRLRSIIMASDPDRMVHPVGQLDITFHRDDLFNSRPIPNVTDVPFDVEGQTIILVDDVIFTGRTTRAALNAMLDLGRSRAIQLAVLIDRGHRQLPIHPDYTGKDISTDRENYVAVRVFELDETDQVTLEDPPK